MAWPAAAATTHHHGYAGVDEVEGRLEVDADHGVPLGLAHAKHQAVFRDACVVDEDVHAAEVFHYFLDRLVGLVEVGGVRGVAFHAYAKGTDLFFCGSTVFVDDEVGECDVCSFRSETQGDGFTNAACGARDEGDFSF